MTDPHRPTRWRLSAATTIAGTMVIAGFLLTEISWWFFLLTAAGTLGPGLLREIGWLADRDEFQRRAEYRAGYLAFLVTACVAFVLVAHIRSGGAFEHPERLASFLLALLWFTWFFSSLLSYWGAPRTAARTLYAFGTVWLVFVILSNLGSEWTGWAALLLHPLLAVPFFALGWLATRKPRLSGALLIIASVGFFLFFEAPRISREGSAAAIIDDGGMLLFLGPLIAGGVALLSVGAEDENEDEDDTPT